MAGTRRCIELRDEIERITVGGRPHRQVSVLPICRLANAGPMAAEAIFKLIDRGSQYSLAIGGAYTDNFALRDANRGRSRERAYGRRGMRVVAIRAGRVAV